MRTCVISLVIPWLEPGKSHVAKQSVATPTRFHRLIARVAGDWPIRTLYQKRTGGSRRKGRRYSLLFSLDTIAHAKGRKPNLSVDDIYIGKTSQLAGSGSIPIDMFAPEFSPDVTMDTAMEGMTVSISVTNREEYQKAQGVLALLGHTV